MLCADGVDCTGIDVCVGDCGDTSLPGGETDGGAELPGEDAIDGLIPYGVGVAKILPSVVNGTATVALADGATSTVYTA